MAEATPNPLTEDDLAELNRGLESARSALALIAQARRAGIDVDAQEAAVKDTEAKLLRLKQTFFPGR